MTGPGKLIFDDLIDDYYAECDEHLAVVRRSLLAMERFVNQPAASGSARGPLNDLFRSFHTIKGLSGMVGLTDAAQLSHGIESYLRALLKGQGAFDSEAMDVLVATARALENVITAHRLKTPMPDIYPVISRIDGLVADSGASAAVASAGKERGRPGAKRATDDLSPEDARRLDEALREGARAWEVVFTPTESLAGRGINVNEIRSRLQKTGELIRAMPNVGEDGRISFQFIVATGEGPEVFSEWEGDGVSFVPYERGLEPPAASRPGVRDGRESAVGAEGPATLSSPGIVRVDLARLDELMQMVGELVVGRIRLEDGLKRVEPLMPPHEWRALQETSLVMDRRLRDLREGIMRVRMVPIGYVFERMEFVAHELAREHRKEVSVAIAGRETEIDKYVIERMMDPLLHLVRNAVGHGLETPEERAAAGKPATGRLELRASTVGDTVAIEIIEDGRGVDAERVISRARASGMVGPDAAPDPAVMLDLLCTAGFSTRDEADMTSGRGVGMAIVKKTVNELGGSLALDSLPGRGTHFTISLPLTLAIVDALIVGVGDQVFAVPASAVREAVQVRKEAVATLERNELVSYRDGVLTLARLSKLFGIEENSGSASYALVAGSGSNPVGIVVDRILGQREIVVRALEDPLVRTPGVSGATEIGDRGVVLILDAADLIRFHREQTANRSRRTDHERDEEH